LEDKALMSMFLLTLLREHRERQSAGVEGLAHMVIIEEAHNLLEDVSSRATSDATTADTRYKTVQMICGMLAEMRALGQGVMIVDQSPEKLAADAIRNTNLQIAHQLRDSADREAIARAMTMEKEQCDYLARLAPGKAAVFRTGLERASFLQVPKYYPDEADLARLSRIESTPARCAFRAGFRGFGYTRDLRDSVVADRMIALDSAGVDRRTLDLPYDACVRCRERRTCPYRDPMFAEMQTVVSHSDAKVIVDAFHSPRRVSCNELWRILVTRCRQFLNRVEQPEENADAAWCALLHMWCFEMARRKAKLLVFTGRDHARFLEEYALLISP
jgi:hypothetical protein